MKLHIVEPYHSTAMTRMAVPLVSELSKIYDVTISENVDESADLNFHIPFHTLVGMDYTGKHAILYTHCNMGAEAALLDACERAELIVCMSFRGRSELVEMGVDPRKIWVIYSAADGFSFKQHVIGVVGYPQPNGRKRESLLLDMAWQYDLSPFQFLFIGKGWDEIAAQLQSLGVTAGVYHAETHENLQMAYRQMDTLLVTGYREGGPLPILEAMASGVDVLSPDFGYASDLLEQDSLYTDLPELMDLLHSKVERQEENHLLARSWSWGDYAAEHAIAFGRMLDRETELYPERGTRRYMQLLNIIAERKPASICEIGTWNGTRAIQMIQEAAKYRPIGEIRYQGFDLFEAQTGELFRRELSKTAWRAGVVSRRIEATGAQVTLVSGDTKDTIHKMRPADFIFVDGGHSEKTIENDGAAALLMAEIQPSAVVVFDDYYHEGKPEGMGCNKFIDTLGVQWTVRHLPERTTAADGRVIGMVEVRLNGNISIPMRTETRTGSNTWNDGEPAYSVSSLPSFDA